MTDSHSRPKSPDRAPAGPASPPVDLPSLYRREFAYVWKTLRRLGAPLSDLEDLAHDVFVVVHRHLDDYDRARPLRPWLCGIAVRVVADYRRLQRNQREVVGETTEAVDAGPTAHERFEAREARALLMKALDALDPDRRAVFVMHELDEVPVPEIAAELGVPLNTAYSRLRLARAEVAAWIARRRAGEEKHDG
jgi:RNA polymerase sigma-70 factor (ECF subfamily)